MAVLSSYMQWVKTTSRKPRRVWRSEVKKRLRAVGFLPHDRCWPDLKLAALDHLDTYRTQGYLTLVRLDTEA